MPNPQRPRLHTPHSPLTPCSLCFECDHGRAWLRRQAAEHTAGARGAGLLRPGRGMEAIQVRSKTQRWAPSSECAAAAAAAVAAAFVLIAQRQGMAAAGWASALRTHHPSG